jgi:hypothetical protein
MESVQQGKQVLKCHTYQQELGQVQGEMRTTGHTLLQGHLDLSYTGLK